MMEFKPATSRANHSGQRAKPPQSITILGGDDAMSQLGCQANSSLTTRQAA